MWRGVLPGIVAGLFWNAGSISAPLLAAAAAWCAVARVRTLRVALPAAAVAALSAVATGHLRATVHPEYLRAGRIADARVMGRRLPAGEDRGLFYLELEIAGETFCLRSHFPLEGGVSPDVGDTVRVLVRRDVKQADGCPLTQTRLLACPSCQTAGPPVLATRASSLLRDIWTKGIAPPPQRLRPPEFAALYDAGLGHLLAVSGLHVGFAAATAWMIVAALAWMLPWRWFAHPVMLRFVLPCAPAVAGTLAGTWFVFGVAGAPASGVRAVALLWVWLGLRFTRRHVAFEWRLLLVVLACAYFPHAAHSIGFVWSLLAVCWLTPLTVLQRASLRWLGMALLPWVGTLPLAAGSGAVAWAGPVANLMATGLTGSLLFPLSWLSRLLPGLGDLFDYGCWLLFRWSEIAAAALPPGATAAGTREVSSDLLFLWGLLPLVVTALYQRKSTVMRTFVVR